MDLRIEFDCSCVCAIWRPDDAGLRVCDVVCHWLYSRGGTRAYSFVMAVDRPACWMDFRQRHFQLADASANCCPPLAGKESAYWNCAIGRNGTDLGNNANVAEI